MTKSYSYLQYLAPFADCLSRRIRLKIDASTDTTKSCFKVISGPNDLAEDRGLFEYSSFGNDMN